MTRPPETCGERSLRNALAEIVLEAFTGPDGAALLDALAAAFAGSGPAEGRQGELRPHAELVGAGRDGAPAAGVLAARLEVARAAHRRHATAPVALAAPLDVAAVLFAHGLFFEVHEVLEPVWQRTSGPRRVVLQGLIQVAVGFHHLAHGKPDSAARLLQVGREKLAPSGSAFDGLDLARLLRECEPWASCAGAGRGWDAALTLPVLAPADAG